jgi:hypothetical protein
MTYRRKRAQRLPAGAETGRLAIREVPHTFRFNVVWSDLVFADVEGRVCVWTSDFAADRQRAMLAEAREHLAKRRTDR